MRKIILLFLSVFIFSFSFASFLCLDYNGPISITKVEYVSNNKVLKISSKVNVLHLEEVLGKKVGAPDFDLMLNRYLKSHIKISVNDLLLPFTFSSKNPDGNVVWIYYEVSGVSDVSSITIKNSLLMDKFPDQQNFTNFIINGKKKSIVCKKGSETGKVNF